jgi:hypothetical protein
VFLQSQGVEGGLDSWNHFLISKCAFLHPDLLLDQWNKPLFTLITVLICQLGFNALIIFNIFCVATSGLFLSLGLKNLGYKNTWSLIPLSAFTPILFQNTISGLTEPLNVLFLSLVFYFWCKDQLKYAVIVASFLPFVRTEGFVICGAVFLMLIIRKDYKLILWLISGSVVMNLVGFAITGKPFWIITENPYWKHETEGTFEAGSGSFFHYIVQGRAIFGLPLEIAFVLSNLFILYCFVAKKKIQNVVLLSVLVFWFYFLAHTTIYYLGILGSHGLTRVMAVIAPPLAILSFYVLNELQGLFKINPKFHFIPVGLFALTVVWTGYHESDYAKPHRFSEATVKADKTQKNFIKAGEWLIENKLMNRPIIHQSPYFDVRFNKDPYNIQSSYRVWSIDQKNDWAAKGVVVIWDGFSAVREGNTKLDWLINNPNYTLLHTIDGFEKPEYDSTMYKICIFEKINSPQ